MTAPTLVRTAALAPGVCALSGDFNGPFIDTMKSLRGFGRIYLSLQALAPIFRQAGYIREDEIKDKLATIERHDYLIQQGEKAQTTLDALLEAIRPFVPEPEPRVIERGIVIDRDVKAENERLKAELQDLRRALYDATHTDAAAAPDAGASPDEDEGSVPEGEAPAPNTLTTTVEVAGQQVNIKDLLDQTYDVVLSVIDGWPKAALEAVAALESAGKARKTILEACA